MDGTRRWRNLGIAAGASAAVVLAAYDLFLGGLILPGSSWLAAYLGDNFHNDFTFYYAAALLGLTHGWANLYDLRLLQEQLDVIGSQITVAQLARYVSPPPLAWVVTPLTLLPYRVAYWVWSAILVGALVLAWNLVAPGSGRARVIYLVAAFGWLPVVYGLHLGQPALLVAAGVAGCYALLRRERDFAAGAALGVLVFKPQLAVLVPVALLVAGRWRAFAGSALVLGVLGIASLIALGPSGISVYESRLAFATTVPENQSQTLAAWMPSLPAARAVQVLVALWTLALAYRFRKRGPAMVLAITLIGGLAASPYVHFDDLTILGLACLLYLRAPRPTWSWIYVLGLVIAGEAQPFLGAGPVLVGEILALALLSVAALKHQDGDAEHHGAEGQHDAGLERDGEHVAVDGQRESLDQRAGPA